MPVSRRLRRRTRKKEEEGRLVALLALQLAVHS